MLLVSTLREVTYRFPAIELNCFIFTPMRQAVGLILILIHTNFLMLIPQTDEVDLQTSVGVQHDDINSLVEYVDQEIFENADRTPEDEDDDKSRDCRFVQVDCSHIIYFAQIISYDGRLISRSSFPGFLADQIPSVSFDIVSPPPEA